MNRKWIQGSLSVEILSWQGVISSSILVSTVPEDFLFDVGDGTLKLLKERAYAFERLHALFFTHGHYDHIGGIWGLLGYMRFIRRESPLPIYYPSGCVELKELIALSRKLFSKGSSFEVIGRELKEHENVHAGALTVHPFAARHTGSISGTTGIIPAFGYTLAAGDARIVISGDTGSSRELMEEVKGADLAIIEATFADDGDVLPDSHLSVNQAARIGKLAKRYVLVHLTEDSYPVALKEGSVPEE